MAPARKNKKQQPIECEYSWQNLCEKDGVPCPGIDDCRHAEEEEMLCLTIKTGMKIVSKQKKYHPL